MARGRPVGSKNKPKTSAIKTPTIQGLTRHIQALEAKKERVIAEIDAEIENSRSQIVALQELKKKEKADQQKIKQREKAAKSVIDKAMKNMGVVELAELINKAQADQAE